MPSRQCCHRRRLAQAKAAIDTENFTFIVMANGMAGSSPCSQETLADGLEQLLKKLGFKFLEGLQLMGESIAMFKRNRTRLGRCQIRNQCPEGADLMNALPYIKKYSNKIVVVKYGGNAMINED